MARQFWVFEIAKMMGRSHRVFWLWDDAHEGNVGFAPGGWIQVFDPLPSRLLYGPPTSAQSATTLVPLMNSFSPTDWETFRAGYIAERGADGERVIDYIQLRDLTGWNEAARRNDLDEAARLVSEQLESDADLPASMRPFLQSVLGGLLSRSGRHAEALAAHRAAVAAAGADGPHLVMVMFNQASALLRAGDASAAITPLEQVVAREREVPTAPGLLDEAIRALEMARTLAG